MIPEDIGDVATIVTDLVANAVRVVITVVDAGHGFAFRDVSEVGSARPETDGGGRLGGFGLPLLGLMSDQLEFTRADPEGTTVRAAKRLRHETPGDADDAWDMSEAGGGRSASVGG